MRDILFKAKRKDNGLWEKGYYVALITSEGKKHYIYTGVIDATGLYPTECRYEIDPETLCQYVGLNDKNDVRIWEHDKCLITRPCTCAGVHIVYKDACFFGYDKLFNSMIKLCDLKLNGYEIEVVSDNPEPMEVQG